jgi:hypothetical protein
MNPLTGWKMAASFVFIAAIAVLFGYSGRGSERILANPPTIMLPASPPAADTPAPREARPPSNEVGDFQQLD